MSDCDRMADIAHSDWAEDARRRIELEREVAQLRGDIGNTEQVAKDGWNAAHRHMARAEKLEALLRELADAMFAEFCNGYTEENESDDSKVSYPEDKCRITFGMIRRARAAIGTAA